jgi:ATP synthase protein I
MAPDDQDDDDARRLAELEQNLRKARQQRGEVQQTNQATAAPPSKLGIAFRLVSELLAGVIVGGAIGWALDRFFGTAPILLIVMFLVGVAAGFVNVMRAAREMNAKPPDGG